MSGTKCLVTGGAGFIGSHLVDALLAGGARVRVLDDFSTGRRSQVPPAAELVEADIADRAAVAAAMHGVDAVFHLAAIASVARANADWPGTHRVNQSGTVTVLDAARAAGGVPVVYASSAAVYGDTGDAVASEDRAPSPRTAYGADKLGSEFHARVASLVHGVPTLGLRFFNVYGPRQDPDSPYSGVISIFSALLARGAPIVLHGDGAQTRDFVHVADVVAHLRAGLALLRDSRAAAVLNVCTGRSVSIRALAGTLAAASGVALRLTQGPPRQGDILHSRGDPSRAAAALGLRADITLEDGLARLLERPGAR